ncbi:MAG TPA: thioesterase family protein [Candidatus Competibacteraceae bacterium]|nr:thioesterase family protein [Candidatus Competibacteraceae bacterium]MCP5132790.1 thioesterase family protein [Gammaproteobacteria bacterium]HPF57577.1 thioesterase family protein [Candidatus Competibacteraceae bacterium]HRY16902.1 thioesterase family protein [Candidatus Competibacteraceae bacterium]
MARIKLDLPADYSFTTELRIRITDVNYGGHLGNDAMLGLLHEARVRFLKHYGFSELDIGGCGLIMTDSALVYKSEAFPGETLVIAIALADFNKYGCDFMYRVTEKASGREVARAKTGIVFFDYAKRAVQKIPQLFLDQFSPNATA